MDVHLTLTLPIGVIKVEEFYTREHEDLECNVVISTWRKE